jgi:hypothetical protein
MGTPYEDFASAQQNVRERISKLNEEITVNRAQHGLALRRYDDATLAGQTKEADEAREAVEELDKKYQWAQRDIVLLSGDGGKRGTAIMAAGSRVIDANRETMKKFQAEWDTIAAELMAHRRAFMEGVAALGNISKQTRSLRTQAEHVFTETQINSPWVSSPEDRDINMIRNKGIIFFDNAKIAQTYRAGKYDGKEK